MIRPTHLIRRTTSCLADLTLNAVATLGCYWQTRWETYQAGAQAAIRGDDWMAVAEAAGCAVEPMTPAQAFAQYDQAMQAEEDALYHAVLSEIVGQLADQRDMATDLAWWERNLHPSNGGAL